jgi:hypothetical protein
MSIICPSCKKKTDLERISFRSVCDHCNACLHCCYYCQYYQVGLANDCKVPGTERILDRQKNNFCEEFSFRKEGFLQREEKDFSRFENLFKKEDRSL